METKKVSIHRALSELKTIDARIQRATQDILPSGIRQHGKKINNVTDEAEFKSKAESAYSSAVDLINRKAKIKSKIVESNSKTTIKIGERTMTVADAICEKGNIMFKKNLIEVLSGQHKRTLAALNTQNTNVDKNLQTILEVTFGKDQTKVNKEDMENVRKPFMEQNEFVVFDPLKIEDKIKALEAEVQLFELEIDSALSESNAVTHIEI